MVGVIIGPGTAVGEVSTVGSVVGDIVGTEAV